MATIGFTAGKKWQSSSTQTINRRGMPCDLRQKRVSPASRYSAPSARFAGSPFLTGNYRGEDIPLPINEAIQKARALVLQRTRGIAVKKTLAPLCVRLQQRSHKETERRHKKKQSNFRAAAPNSAFPKWPSFVPRLNKSREIPAHGTQDVRLTCDGRAPGQTRP